MLKTCNFLAHLPPAEYMRFRRVVIELVLATDMKVRLAVHWQHWAWH